MPSKKIMYECKYCGKEYSDYDECKEHEETHVLNFDNVDTKEIVQRLRELGESAYVYHVGNRVLGIPAKNFENLMTEAARRLEEQDKVVEQLKSVSYERYGNDDGMGGERVINLDDAIEIVKGGGDMREGEKMELQIGLQLSDTMLDTIDKMSKYGKLVRYDGGFWSWENTELEPLYNGGIFQCMVPSWHCDVKTLRALSKRNIVILDEEHKWCRLKGEKHNAD